MARTRTPKHPWTPRKSICEQAIELDPTFSRAWSALASVIVVKAENGYLDAMEGYERARELTQHALELSPNNADAHAELASIYQTYDWDWAAAEVKRNARLLSIRPIRLLNQAGRLSATLGRWDDAVRQFRAALVRDPLNDYAIFNLGIDLLPMRSIRRSRSRVSKVA